MIVEKFKTDVIIVNCINHHAITRTDILQYQSVDTERFLITTVVSSIGLWCLSPLLAIFQLYWGGQVRKLEYPEETTDLSQVAEKLYHIMLHRVHIAMNAVMGTACIEMSILNNGSLEGRDRHYL
jgi:cytochrome b561